MTFLRFLPYRDRLDQSDSNEVCLLAATCHFISHGGDNKDHFWLDLKQYFLHFATENQLSYVFQIPLIDCFLVKQDLHIIISDSN